MLSRLKIILGNNDLCLGFVVATSRTRMCVLKGRNMFIVSLEGRESGCVFLVLECFSHSFKELGS